jgi:hypothetical protein
MRKLPEVREAKDLMNEALDWSTFRWLLEKPRVRATADRANAALDKLEKTAKAHWSDEIRAVYKSLSGKAGSARQQRKDPQQPRSAGGPLNDLIEKLIEADKAAQRARMDAEETFDKAEKHMCVSLAREGCKKAIHSWELHEKAIRKAEAIVNPASAEDQAM